MKYLNPDLKNSMLPTMEQIKKYLQLVRDKNKTSRDARPLLSVLQQLAKVDRFLMGLIQTRKIAVLGFNYTIKFPDEYPANETEKKQIEEIKMRFVKSNMHKSLPVLMNGILFGLTAINLLWKNDTEYGAMVIKKFNLDLTELDINLEDSDKLDLINTTDNNRFERSDLDPDIHLFSRYNPLAGIDNDFIGSYMFTNMIYSLLKYWDYYNWSSANERYSDPLRYAQYKKGTNSEEVSKILAGLAQLGSDSYAAFSDDVEVKLIEALRQGITDMHKEFIAAINSEMSISILGQTLTTDVSKIGSFAAAKVHNFVRQDILWGDILEIQNIMSTQYVMKDYFLNYSEPRNAYPIFEFNTDEIIDFESNSRIVTELKGAGYNLDDEEVSNKTGFTVQQSSNTTNNQQDKIL